MQKHQNCGTVLQPRPLTPGTLVSDKTAAAALSISRSHFWGYVVKQNKLTPVKLSPRTTRFRADEVLALISDMTPSGKAA